MVELEPVEGRVRDVTHAGDAVVETAQGIVLARGGLPGERVRVGLGRRARGVLRGALLEVLEASPSRIASACALSARCGGCPLMTLEVRAEHALKRERLSRLLARAGAAVEPELRHGSCALGYRTRARLAFAGAAGSARLGYRAAASDEVVDVAHCPLLAPSLERALQALRAQILPLLRGRGEIVLAQGAGGRAVIAIASAGPQPTAVEARAQRLCTQGTLAGAVLRVVARRRRAAAMQGARVTTYGDPRQHAQGLDGLALLSPVSCFAQANAELNLELARCVRALAEPAGARVLELYAGHGNLTIGLADAAALTAVESDAMAVAALRDNLRARGIDSVEVRCISAELGAAREAALDAVVLDPPRAGARAAISPILARRPARIVYVSCDPATLARDLSQLIAGGYRVDRALAFDMFPRSAHLESVVRLQRVANDD